MRSIISYFIKYPVAVNIAMIATILFGWSGLRQLRSSFFPQQDSTIITISVAYPGASPEEMEEGVVLKIEDNLRGLVGIDRVTSVSSENSARITVETFEDADIDVILADVKNAVDRVPSFPTGMEPPVVAKQEAVDVAIVFTISGEKVPLRTLKKISRQVEDDLRAIEGISQVTVSGFPDEEIEIAVREQDLRAYDLTFDEVTRAVANANILTTGGNIKTETEEYLIRANNRSYYGEELDYLVVRASPTGNVVRLKDVATVRDRWSEVPERLYFNGNEALSVQIDATNNEDMLGVSGKVNEYIKNYNETHDNIRLTVSEDRAISLNERTRILTDNGLIGIIMVIILLSLFLKPSLAFWVAVGIPISFFGMFMFAPMFMTINVMSLFGMIIVIGILVDDGIVIGENIYHHYEKGKTPVQAAIDGTMEVAPAIISAILTTMVAFSIFLFLEGRIGAFYTEVSIVVMVTLGFSLIEALIILPSHVAHSRAMKKGSQSFLLNRWSDQGMSWMRDTLYSPVLRFFLKNKILGFAIPVALLILTFAAIQGGIIRSTFFPTISSDRVNITLKMPQGTPEAITDSLITVIEQATWEVNKDFTAKQTGNLQVVENTIRNIGPGSSNASLTINLLPGEARDVPAIAVANAVRDQVGELYGVESLVYGSGGSFGGKPVSVSLMGNNIADLKGAKEELKAQLKAMSELKDVTDTDPAGIKEIDIKLKENAYLLGLTLNSVMAQVRSGFFGQSVQRFQRGRDEIRVWVRYEQAQRKSIKSLDDMWIVTPTRDRVPLSEIAEYSIARGEVAINHLNGVREIKVEAEQRDRDASVTDLLAGVQNNVMPDILARYPSVTVKYEGQNREAAKIGGSAGKALPAILVLIFAIIGFTFRSYSQPILLFSMVPFSLIGVAWGHWIHGHSISILSLLGVIALIGIVVNDGLVLVGKYNGFLKEGLGVQEALYEAGRSRFRAIFLTSITTVAGLMPLIFEPSFTAQFLIPMAISIAYGIMMATFMTLLMLPLLLSISNSTKVGGRWLITGKKPTREEVESAVREQEAERQATAEFSK